MSGTKERESSSHPFGCFDANEWAKEFKRIAVDGNLELDVDFLRAWFANAIMTGYDQGRREERERLRGMVRGSLQSYNLHSYEGEDGEKLPLVDFLSPGNTIKEGEDELDLLAEHIVMDLEESK